MVNFEHGGWLRGRTLLRAVLRGGVSNRAADLVVGWQGDPCKNGSIRQSEGLAKYNRLLAIERETGWPVRPWRRPAGTTA